MNKTIFYKQHRIVLSEEEMSGTVFNDKKIFMFKKYVGDCKDIEHLENDIKSQIDFYLEQKENLTIH